jgi:hypothetical protein
VDEFVECEQDPTSSCVKPADFQVICLPSQLKLLPSSCEYLYSAIADVKAAHLLPKDFEVVAWLIRRDRQQFQYLNVIYLADFHL